jgi:hypothetical protein
MQLMLHGDLLSIIFGSALAIDLAISYTALTKVADIYRIFEFRRKNSYFPDHDSSAIKGGWIHLTMTTKRG